ncbi:hypothetical protein J437_LFUL012334 [Ladona fulva]|uniref:Uncharacterized protein n=1 Tax=Ladona fulva TaxID=123851 RepID=A0A8K0KIF3_LADFU|nr:hypothetical protein J437_LFUL012334 [Ladona fulva]
MGLYGYFKMSESVIYGVGDEVLVLMFIFLTFIFSGWLVLYSSNYFSQMISRIRSMFQEQIFDPPRSNSDAPGINIVLVSMISHCKNGHDRTSNSMIKKVWYAIALILKMIAQHLTELMQRNPVLFASATIRLKSKQIVDITFVEHLGVLVIF